jgi:hypothetical protein
MTTDPMTPDGVAHRLGGALSELENSGVDLDAVMDATRTLALASIALELRELRLLHLQITQHGLRLFEAAETI